MQRDTFCIGYQVLMTWSGTFGDFSLNSFIWNDGITALSRTETPTVTTAYSYTAVLTVIANTQTCAVQGYTTAIVKGCAAGIESYNKSPVHISVYPNPASTVLQIESENEYLDNSQIEIANVIGQTILSLPFSNMLNISTLSQGVYMLKITGQQSQVYYSKFVKE
ncbi:MAG: T9SS type A sorting domain-containing protein [Mucilaginibacter sp.]